ncbi:MAG: response regulator [Wenzhouxiangella sp.]|nr:MAG: response regulator [Wenzhouxiangella sp.]
MLIGGFLSMIGAAVANDVRFDRLTMADGLSQSSVAAIAQCDDGYIWLGTQYGLDRYDGYSIRSFRRDPDDPYSLSHSNIRDLRRGRDGRLWVATRAGLNRFDTLSGRAERFEVVGPPDHMDQRLAFHIVDEHKDGRLFLSAAGAVRIWRPDTQQVHRIPFASDLEQDRLSIRSAVLDRQGRYWVFNAEGLWRLNDAGQRMDLVLALPQQPEFRMYQALDLTSEGLLALAADHVFKLVDPDTLEILERLDLDDLGGVDQRINGVMATSDGMIWLPTPPRLLRFNPADGELRVLFDGERLDPNEVSRQEIQAHEHPNGDLWFASQYGLARVNRETEEVRIVFHDPADPHSMPPTVPQLGIALFIDDEGTVWVGTHLGGVGRHSPGQTRFRHIVDRNSPATSPIPYAGQNVVRGVVETTINGTVDLWLALERAGVRRLRKGEDGQFRWHQSFHERGPDERRLPDDTVWGLARDPLSSLVWVVGERALIAIDAATDRIVNRIELDLSGRAVRISRRGDRMWVGTANGILTLAIGEDREQPVAESADARMPELHVSNLLETDGGSLVAVGFQGIGFLDMVDDEPDLLIPVSEVRPDRDGGLFALAPHSRQGWWIGGRETGLGYVRLEMDAQGRPMVQADWLDRGDGLADETVYAVLPEANGRVWLSTNNGLMLWNPETSRVRQFTLPDGLQALEFNRAVAYRSERGYFYFGGINGVNQFRPEAFSSLRAPPRVLLQEVRVNGQVIDSVNVQENPLRLRHDENDLEVQFVGLNFADPQRVRYAFKLSGVDGDWVDGGSRRQARYASLRPGTYSFHVRAANSDGVWSEDSMLLTATVAAPPWATPWALAAYGLLLMLVATAIHVENLRRRRALESQVAARTAALTEQQALVERQARDLEQALEARTVLFANVSHEFRTPLTLIKTSLDRLDRDGSNPEAVTLGRRYLRRLLKLVDQLMDFSRLSYEQCEAGRKPWPLGRMVRMTVDAFSAVAEERGIELIVEVEHGWRTRCHQEQIEKILLNLLTNALKFTPAGGQVRVRLEAGDDGARLSVADSGRGIPDEELETIFERFYRVPAVEQEEVFGAGIGLALVWEAARANGGRVSVTSRVGEGSCFSVFLPAWREAHAAAPMVLLTEREHARDIEALKPIVHSRDQAEPVSDSVRPTVLVIEDNADMRAHLRELLETDWRVLEAADGDAGRAMACSEMPDVIVSDIMMPGLSGLDLLKSLRSDIKTSHIPIMLLTARHDHDTRVQAFTLQADDFLPKPFEDDEFCVRLSSMMAARRRLRDQLRRELGGEPRRSSPDRNSADIGQRDRELLERLHAWVESHYPDPGIKVADLADATLVDVRTLQRKLKSLLDRTPAAYLQEFRLQKAREMLADSDRSVKDIAASCGFSTPQAFSKIFTQVEGLPPSRWRKRPNREGDFE